MIPSRASLRGIGSRTDDAHSSSVRPELVEGRVILCIGRASTGSARTVGDALRTVPGRVAVDLGWADIEVIGGREIRFKSGGESTNVGTRVASNTVGMTLDGMSGGEPVLGSSAKFGESRPSFSKKKSAKRRSTGHKAMTTLKGVRP